MKLLFRIVAYLGAALIGLFGWNLAVRVFLDHTVNSPSARAEGEFYKMEREAETKYAGIGTPVGVALSRYASERAARMVAEAAPEDRAFTAAQIFMGFYLTNTRARVEFCREQKIDLANFADAFATIHTRQHERAAALLAAKGMTVDDTWSTLRPALMHAVELDIGATSGISTSVAAACHEIALRSSYFAGQLDFAHRQPEVQRALMER
jgi:hypothetical protein